MPLQEIDLRTQAGKACRLDVWHDKPLLVLVFLGTECPMARRYIPTLNELARRYAARGVQIVGIDSNARDSQSDLDQFWREHSVEFPLLLDPQARLADALDAQRSPQAFLLDADRRVRYRGNIDDRLTVAAEKPHATRHNLARAIQDLLAGTEVEVAITEPGGCWIDRASRQVSTSSVTYQQVAPIFERHCAECHHPAGIGRISFATHAETRSWAATIRDVIESQRMPPWGADPRYGHFQNERRLSARERRRILDWIERGAAEGPPNDAPSPTAPTPSPGEWSIRADEVLSLPRSMQIRADGLVEYQQVELGASPTDRWVRAVEIMPSNRAVLHHATAFLSPPGTHDVGEQGQLGSFCLATYTPGTTPNRWPSGMAKRIPAGWKIVLVLHYVTVGSPQTDCTRIGLELVAANRVEREVATRLLFDPELRIPPRVEDYRIERTWRAPADVWLLSLFPHMHLRGKSFRYEAEYPSGQRETLLFVPRYDFNWQHRYDLATPKRLPQGTVLHCTAHYDNSSRNLANPAPDVEVHAGKQTTDEMFNAYFDVALADAPRQVPAVHGLGFVWSALLCAALGLLARRWSAA